MAINQQITALPDAPNRLDRDNFATDMHAFFVGMQAMTVELETFRGEANTTATGVNTDVTAAVTARTAAQTAQTAAEAAQTAAENAAGASTWSYATSYSLNDAVSGADGLIYKSLTGNSGNCPHGYNQVSRSGATNHFVSETVTVADPSGRTYTLKVKMWRETLAGNISLVIEEGSGDFEIMVYSSKAVTQTVAEYSATATFPAGSDTDVRVRINPDDNDGPDGDLFGVHSVFLYDHADPGTNLLTGDDTWETDLTGWTGTNCTISGVSASQQNWVSLSVQYSPIVDLAMFKTHSLTSPKTIIWDIQYQSSDFISLANHLFTLEAGTYFIEWEAIGIGGTIHSASISADLYDDTNITSYGGRGESFSNPNDTSVAIRSVGKEIITLTSPATFRFNGSYNNVSVSGIWCEIKKLRT